MGFISQQEERVEKIPSPIQKWVDWNAKNGVFEWYDKEKREKTEYSLTNFSLIKIGYQFQGWKDRKVTSNEIDNFNENLKVREFNRDGGITVLEEGTWEEIKETIKEYGKLHIRLTGVDSNGDIVSLAFSGNSYAAVQDFIKNNDLVNNAMVFDGTEEGSKGATRWLTPKFKTKKLTKAENDARLAVEEKLMEYYSNIDARYGTKNAETTDESVDDDTEDDLPF